MSNDAPKQDEPQKRWYRPSAAEGWTYALVYVFSFLIFRFDIRKQHTFENPMSYKTAALWGLGLTLAMFEYHKLKDSE